MSTLEARWDQLAFAGDPVSGYVRLRLSEITCCAVYVAKRVGDGLEALIVEVRTDALPRDATWPRSRGFSVIPIVLEPGRTGRTRLLLALTEARYSELFRSLVDDLLRRVAMTNDEVGAARILLGHLTKWQAFLRASGDGLSVEAQRGLVGEFTLMRDELIRRFGSSAVVSWTGWSAANHDFQLPGGHLEVKATVANTPHAFRVSNAGQLDQSTCGQLYLCLTSLAESQTIGESLSDIVQSIRHQLDALAGSEFDDKLLEVGVMPSDPSQYSTPCYAVRSRTLYHVLPGFPRLIPQTLPSGIEDVTYSVSVAACDEFKVDFNAGIEAISSQERAPRE